MFKQMVTFNVLLKYMVKKRNLFKSTNSNWRAIKFFII